MIIFENMEENLLTHSDSRMAGKVTVFMESLGNVKTVEISLLLFRNLKDNLYYVVMLDVGQIASGHTIQEAFECVEAYIEILNQKESVGFKMPKTPKCFIREYIKLSQ
jgi:hypothetical protein